MSKIKVKITQKHIDDSFADRNGKCPVERAMEETLDILAHVGYNRAVECDGSRKWNMSSKARTLAINFDEGLPIQPMTVELEEII